MSNDNDNATQLGSIGHHMNKPQQPGNPQARPAFQAPSLPTHPQEQSGDDEGTVLSAHNANHYATDTFDADDEGTMLSAYNAMPYRPAMPTVPTTQPLKARPAQPVQMRQPLPQPQPIPAAASPSQARAPAATSFNDVRSTSRHHRIPQPVHQTGRQRLPGCGRQGAADPPMCHRHDRWRPHSA